MLNHCSNEEWSVIFDEQSNSGMSVKEFCAS